MKLWIARDKNGNLWFHKEKPHINKYDNAFWTSYGECYEVEQDFLTEVTFENSPMEVQLIVKQAGSSREE